MFPNPQDALPLPPRPSLEQYKKRAKDLVKACQSDAPEAIIQWVQGWKDIAREAGPITTFAQQRKASARSHFALSDAQFVIARVFGFVSWPKFAAHLESLERESSGTTLFESAADAIVAGDAATLQRLLREHPDLARARSTREHTATLLIYVSANGVEGYRQKSPKNAAAIAEILLDAGADVDATAAVYGGECTALGLVATSTPPDIAGVQIPIIELLLRRGARMDLHGSAGNNHSLVRACLANGQPRAAKYLADHGAPLDVIGAAGLGRVDALPALVDAAGVTPAQKAEALAIASAYGRPEAVAFLLDRGMPVDAELTFHGAGHTALHVASFHGHAGVVKLLLARGASVHAIDKTWGTPPLRWVLTGWAIHEASNREGCYTVVALLVGAGAEVAPHLLESPAVRNDPKMLAALQGKLPA